MTLLLADGTGGLATLGIVLLIWATMPITAIIALGLAYRGLGSRLDWGWISLAGLVLAAPYITLVGLFGPGATAVFPLALGVKNGIALVALLNPVVAVLIVMVLLGRLANRRRPVAGTVTRPAQPATRLTVDPRRARAAAVGLALAAGILLALPAGQIDRRVAMALLLFLIPIAAVTAVVRRPVADRALQRSEPPR